MARTHVTLIVALIAIAQCTIDGGSPPPPTTFHGASGAVNVDVNTSPFSLVIRNAQNDVLLESAPAALAVTHENDDSTTTLVTGWDYYKGDYDPWTQVT